MNDADATLPLPEGDSREGQEGWIYAVTEDYMQELLLRAVAGESAEELMLELWAEAEDTDRGAA